MAKKKDKKGTKKKNNNQRSKSTNNKEDGNTRELLNEKIQNDNDVDSKHQKGNEIKLLSIEEVEELKIKYAKTNSHRSKHKKRSIFLKKRCSFIFGGILGCLFTLLFTVNYFPKVKETFLNSIPIRLDFLPKELIPNLSSYLDSYVGDLDISAFIPDMDFSALTNFTAAYIPSLKDKEKSEDFYPGIELKEKFGLKAKHSVVFIPGIVSTGLEVWNAEQKSPHENKRSTTSCGLKYFRKRMWGTINSFRAILLDKECWFEHMRLDSVTGLDPEGVKLRAAQGLDAADYLFPGYWVWARIISNLAVIGYDSNNMFLAAYDWRLSFSNLEIRDLYFTKLKHIIELAFKSGVKEKNGDLPGVLVLTHSMGANVFQYFLSWVTSPVGGNGGADWPDKYLQGWVNIGGPMLGTPKAIPSTVSGEMRDTAQLNEFSSYVLESFFSKKQRSLLWRSWGGIGSLIIRGGSTIWGNETFAPDDLTNSGAYGPILEIAKLIDPPMQAKNKTYLIKKKKITGDKLSKFLNDNLKDIYHRDEYASHIATSQKEIDDSIFNTSFWANPLLSPLPKFGVKSKFSVTCIYGVGSGTERKYYYKDTGKNFDSPDSDEMRYMIDTDVQNPDLNIKNGVLSGNGDATVPLISLGYMCVEGWKRKRYNPSGVPIVTREYKDNSKVSINPFTEGNLRGGPETADHVDIMGNFKVIEDVLKLASGYSLKDKIHSNIKEISKRVELPKF